MDTTSQTAAIPLAPGAAPPQQLLRRIGTYTYDPVNYVDATGLFSQEAARAGGASHAGISHPFGAAHSEKKSPVEKSNENFNIHAKPEKTILGVYREQTPGIYNANKPVIYSAEGKSPHSALSFLAGALTPDHGALGTLRTRAD